MGGSRLYCPACGPAQPRLPYGERGGFPLVLCTGCGLVFLRDHTTPVHDDFYVDAARSDGVRSADAIEYWSFPRLYDAHRPVFEHFFAERWQRLAAAKTAIGSLLDIGCGYGFFLGYVRDRVRRVEGIEINAAAAAHARERFGLAVSEQPIEVFEADTTYDCITMCDVLEHLPRPDLALARCHELLAPGGILFVQVPNLVGFRLPAGHSWGLPHHLWQFGPNSLFHLTEDQGFERVAWHTGVMGVIGAYERGGPTLSERVTWSLARRLRIGNRLMLIARKPTEEGLAEAA